MSSNRFFWVTLIDFGRGDGVRAFRLIFECEFESVDALCTELREFGVVNGVRLRVREDDAGGRVVFEREDFIFGAAAVASIQPYTRTIQEVAS